jgi:hypothetical protein
MVPTKAELALQTVEPKKKKKMNYASRSFA